jgi:hypothetical protein
MQQWYYTRGGQTYGPFPIADMRKKLADGTLRADDLVAQEGTADWVPARTVAALLSPSPAPAATKPARPAQPPRPVAVAVGPPAKAAPSAGVVVAVSNAAPARRSVLASLLLLPKPILFALFGMLGGLFGAVVVGELAWFILSPASAGPPQPKVRMAIPESMRVYAGDKNFFVVHLARDHFDGPISISAVYPPEGVTVDAIQVPAASDEASIDVAVAASVPPGKYTLKLRGAGPDASKALADLPTLELNVEAAPTSLRIAAPPKLTLYAGGKGKFLVRIGRSNFTQATTVTVLDLPEGVSAAPVQVPAGAEEGWVEVSAIEGLRPGAYAARVTAQSDPPSGPVAATTDLQIEVLTVPVPKADIFFVLDLTSSMQFAINGIKNGIQSFASQLEKRRLDARIGLVGFRDIEDDRERPFVLQINGEALTRDFATFRTEVGKLKAKGGGDDPESSLQGLALAAEQPFRPDAARVLLLVTDALPKIHAREKVRTIEDTIQVLKDCQINQLHLVVHQRDLRDAYGKFQKAVRGSFFDLNRAKDSAAFEKILPELSEEISKITTAEGVAAPEAAKPLPLPSVTADPLAPATSTATLKAVQSTESYSSAQWLRLLLAVAFWTIVIAIAISLLIIAGQALYARQGLMTLSEGGRGLAGGIIAGLCGGIVGQAVFLAAAGGTIGDILGRLVGWTLLGGLIGFGMAFFVPNLKWYRGIAGGVLGGFLGAMAFLIVSFVLGVILWPWLGALLGRLIGAAILGFCIGLMIALAELVFRRWWLEVSFSPREVRTVTLGAVPISVGGNERRVSVFVPGAAPIAFRFSVDQDRVLCEDPVAKTTTEIHPGDQRMLGKVRVTLCSAAHAKRIGYRLQLSNGKSVQLTEGLPLTADELPGLQPVGKDGVVALIATHPSNPGALLLRNRSGHAWSAESRDGIFETIEPARSIAVEDGMRISFGSVTGTLKRDRG